MCIRDSDNPGQQRIVFSAVEGFVPPAAVELATTASAPTESTAVGTDESPAGDSAASAD